MSTYNLENKDEHQKMITFYFNGLIQFAALEYKKYKSFNIKVDCKEHVLEGLRIYLEAKKIFRQD